MRKKRIVMLAGATVSAAALGHGPWPAAIRIHYRMATVENRDINVAISSTGNPNGWSPCKVGTQVAGVVLALSPISTPR